MSGFMRLQLWQEPAERLDDPRYGDVVPRSEAEADGSRASYSVDRSDYSATWWAEYSAPGYMDRTDTVGPYEDPIEATLAAITLYGDNEPGSDDRREAARIIRNIRNAR